MRGERAELELIALIDNRCMPEQPIPSAGWSHQSEARDLLSLRYPSYNRARFFDDFKGASGDQGTDIPKSAINPVDLLDFYRDTYSSPHQIVLLQLLD
jgi:hypothetical protein